MKEAKRLITMRNSSEDMEIAQLRDEIRHLRALLAGQEAGTEKAALLPTATPLPDFHALFEALPNMCVAFLPDAPRFTIAAVSDAYLHATHTTRERLLGRGLFEAFPDNPDDLQGSGSRNLRASLETVLRERTAHTLPRQRYDVQRSLEEGVGFEERYWSLLSLPVLGSNGEVVSLLHCVEEVTDRVRLEKQEAQERAARLQAEERAAHILEGMSDAFLVLDREWRIRFMNREAARLNGKAPEAFLGKTHWEEWPASIGSPVEAAYRRAMAEQVAVHLEHHYQDESHDVWLEISAYPTDESLGLFYRDIGERKRAEAALYQSEERFRTAVRAVSDIVWTNGPTGQMQGEQAGWAAFTGQSYDAYQGDGWAKAVHTEDAQPTIDAWNDAVEARKTFVFEHRLRRHDGAWRLCAIRAVPVVNTDGSIREWVGVHTDITAQRESEDEIHALNARLRRAMTETHHRVKNNLQLIAALIEMQRQGGKDSPSTTDLLRLKQNIQALGVIHDILTKEAKTGDVETLSVKTVLQQFLPILQATLGERRLVAQIEDARLPAKQATSLAVVVNELVSNAVKHGKGAIEITLRVADQRVTLEVCDDGPGFGPTFDVETAANTGLELIENITRYDLRGETRYENREEGGAKITLVFQTSTESREP